MFFFSFNIIFGWFLGTRDFFLVYVCALLLQELFYLNVPPCLFLTNYIRSAVTLLRQSRYIVALAHVRTEICVYNLFIVHACRYYIFSSAFCLSDKCGCGTETAVRVPAMNDGSYALEIDNKLHYIAGDYYDFRSADKVC